MEDIVPIYNIEHDQLVIMNHVIRKELEEVTDNVVDDILSKGITELDIEEILIRLKEIKPSRRYINAAIAMICRKLVDNGKLLVCIPDIQINLDNLPSSFTKNYTYRVVDIKWENILYKML